MKAMVQEDPDWMADAVATIVGLAHAQDLVTADDLRHHMRPANVANWIGQAFSAARSAGYITAIGYQQSTTKSRKNGVQRVWTLNKGVEQ